MKQVIIRHKHKIVYSSFTLVILLLLFQSQCHRFKTKVSISDNYKNELTELGKQALITEDVPVAALLIYKDSIIGKGYNTVKKDHNLSGHAEINALNMAYANYGEEFYNLDRKDLILYSTFEPCPMCKGALLVHKIERVYFERNKPFIDQVKGSISSLFYEWNKRRFDAENLQENLFEMHPDYNRENE